jgi:hypothetical protein
VIQDELDLKVSQGDVHAAWEEIVEESRRWSESPDGQETLRTLRELWATTEEAE